VSVAAITLLDSMFFFVIPIAVSAAITLCLAVASLIAPAAIPQPVSGALDESPQVAHERA
jgi:hypothetical protein